MNLTYFASNNDLFVEYLATCSNSGSTWEDTVKSLLRSLEADHFQILFTLTDFSLQKSQEQPQITCFRSSLLPIVVCGFRLLHDHRQYYIPWLHKLFDLIKNNFSTFAYTAPLLVGAAEGERPFKPRASSFIGAICMIFYIERYYDVTSSSRLKEYDDEVAPLEHKLVQLVAIKDPDSIVFPLAFIGSDIMVQLGAVGAADTTKTWDQVMEFMSTYFSIKLPIVSTNLFFSEYLLKEWRTILLKNNAASVRNVILVYGIFTECCSVTLEIGGACFVKQSSRQHDSLSHWTDVFERLPNNYKDYFDLIKNLTNMEMRGVANRPICCKKISSVVSIFDKSVKKLLDPNNPWHHKGSELLGEFLGTCTVQEDLTDMLGSISWKTWESLRQESSLYYASLDESTNTLSSNQKPLLESLVENLLNLNLEFRNPLAKSLCLTWHQYTLLMGPFSFANAYMNLLERKAITTTTRIRLLESIEAQLTSRIGSSSHATVIKGLFLEVLRLLHRETSPISGKTSLDLKLMYFDLRVLLDAKKKSLFKLNVLTHFFVTEQEAVMVQDDDMEEGEEVEGLPEEMNDVVAVHHLFAGRLYELFPDYAKIESLCLNRVPGTARFSASNLLLPKAIFSSLSGDPSECLDLVCLFVEYWKVVAIALPTSAFRASVQQAFTVFVLDSVELKVVDRVFIDFMFSNSWAMKEFSGPIFQIVETKYSKSLGVMAAMRSHFESLASTSQHPLLYSPQYSMAAAIGPWSEELLFFKGIVKDIAVRLAWLKIPNAKSKVNKKKGVDESTYSFFTTANFPRSLLLFLADCLASCSDACVDAVFQHIVAEMKLDRVPWDSKEIVDANNYEVIFVALYLLSQTSMVRDIAMKSIFLQQDPSSNEIILTATVSKLTMAQALIQEFLMTAENYTRPVPLLIQQCLLSAECGTSEKTKNLFKYLKMMFFGHIIPQSATFKDVWFRPLMDVAIKDDHPFNAFSSKITKLALSTHYDFLVLKSGCFSLLLEFFNQNGEKPGAQVMLQRWMLTNKVHYQSVLSNYSEKLVPSLKSNMEQLFLELITSPTASTSIAKRLLGSQLLEENAKNDFLTPLYKKIFESNVAASLKSRMAKDLCVCLGQVLPEMSANLTHATKSNATLRQFRFLISILGSFLDIDPLVFSCLLLDDCIQICLITSYPSLSGKDCKSIMNLWIKMYGLLDQRKEEELDHAVLEKIDRQWSLFMIPIFASSVHPSKPVLSPLFFQLVDFLLCLVKRVVLPPNSSLIASQMKRLVLTRSGKLPPPPSSALATTPTLSGNARLDDYWIDIIVKHFQLPSLDLPRMLETGNFIHSTLLLELIEKYWIDCRLANSIENPSLFVSRHYIVKYLVGKEDGLDLLLKLSRQDSLSQLAISHEINLTRSHVDSTVSANLLRSL